MGLGIHNYDDSGRIELDVGWCPCSWKPQSGHVGQHDDSVKLGECHVVLVYVFATKYLTWNQWDKSQE